MSDARKRGVPAPEQSPSRRPLRVQRRLGPRLTVRWACGALGRLPRGGWAAALAALVLGLALTTAGAPAAEAPAGEAGQTAQPEATQTPQLPAAHMSGGALFGVGDQSPAMFSDPLFRWLGVRYARLDIAWDATRVSYELEAATAWLNAAKEAGVHPLVSFDKDYARPHELPSLATYSEAVGEFMKRFPWVTEYEPWNEENQEAEPTYANPARAASYYNWLHGACKGCTVLAADVLDGPSMEHWLKGFLPHVHNVALWGLHPYFELTYGGENPLSKFWRLVHGGHVWFTEAGEPVWQYTHSRP